MKINSEIMSSFYNNSIERDMKSMENKIDSSKAADKYKVNLSPAESRKKEDERLKVLASEFTSILMKQVFKSMRKTVPDGELLDGGFSEDVFTDMLDGEISKTGANQKEFSSLASILYRQLKGK